jgi:hypothetical protein
MALLVSPLTSSAASGGRRPGGAGQARCREHELDRRRQLPMKEARPTEAGRRSEEVMKVEAKRYSFQLSKNA